LRFIRKFELALIGFALAAALWRRRAVEVSLAIVIVLTHIGLAFVAYVPLVYYVMPLGVFYALLVAALFQPRPSQPLRPLLGVLALAIGLGYTLTQPVEHLLRRDPVQLPVSPVAAWVRDHIPTGSIVVGEHYYYLFLIDYQFTSAETINLMPPAVRAEFESDEAIWDSIAPDAVIIDANYSTCCIPPILDPAYLESRGYHAAAEFEGAHVPVVIYTKGRE
jgi:hypothetical protein